MEFIKIVDKFILNYNDISFRDYLNIENEQYFLCKYTPAFIIQFIINIKISYSVCCKF